MVEIAPSALNEYLAESELQKGNRVEIIISWGFLLRTYGCKSSYFSGVTNKLLEKADFLT